MVTGISEIQALIPTTSMLYTTKFETRHTDVIFYFTVNNSKNRTRKPVQSQQ